MGFCECVWTSKWEWGLSVFWNELSDCLGSFESNVRVCLLGDLNARVGSDLLGDVVGPWGVGEVNRNGEELIGLCVERGMCVENTWFKKRDIHKYTWVSGVNGDRALLDFVCVKVGDRKRLIDVNVLRGAAGGVSDHYLVETKLRVKGGIGERGAGDEGVLVIKHEKLEGEEYGGAFEREIREVWGVVKNTETRGVEEEWGNFKEVVLEKAKEVCGVRKLGGKGKRRGSEWWND